MLSLMFQLPTKVVLDQFQILGVGCHKPEKLVRVLHHLQVFHVPGKKELWEIQMSRKLKNLNTGIS